MVRIFLGTIVFISFFIDLSLFAYNVLFPSAHPIASEGDAFWDQLDQNYLLHLGYGIITYGIAIIALWKKSYFFLRAFDLMLIVKFVYVIRIYLLYSFPKKDVFMTILVFGPDFISLVLTIILDRQFKREKLLREEEFRSFIRMV